MQDKSFTAGRPLRVAYVVHTFDMGGLERCVAHLCNCLDRAQFRPMIVCLNRTGSAARWITAGDVPVVELHKRPSNDVKLVGRLARTLREHHADILHSHNWGTLMETAVARRWARVPCHVHTEHGQGLHAGLRGLRRLLRGWATRWALSRADAAVICAESVRGLIHARCGFPQSRIRFIPNGVDTPATTNGAPEPERLRSQLGLSQQAFVVGSVGRLVPVKDFPTAIAAIALLVQDGCDVHLVLVGDGPDLDALQIRAKAAGIADRVHLVGRQEKVGDWLRLFDVYVNSSSSEAMSMGILEAMAAGVPVVATDVGDHSSILDGDSPCGVVVPPGEAPRLASAMDGLLRDPGRRRSLAHSARNRYASMYSVQCMIRNHESLYLQCAERPAACRGD